MKNKIKFYYLLYLLTFTCWAYNDPTKPPNVSNTAKGQTMNLTAIFIYPNKRIAIIDGQTLQKGDKINQFIISTIRNDNVELIGPNSSKETLYLLTNVKTSIKQ